MTDELDWEDDEDEIAAAYLLEIAKYEALTSIVSEYLRHAATVYQATVEAEGEVEERNQQRQGSAHQHEREQVDRLRFSLLEVQPEEMAEPRGEPRSHHAQQRRLVAEGPPFEDHPIGRPRILRAVDVGVAALRERLDVREARSVVPGQEDAIVGQHGRQAERCREEHEHGPRRVPEPGVPASSAGLPARVQTNLRFPVRRVRHRRVAV